jgi:hypothetical protein
VLVFFTFVNSMFRMLINSEFVSIENAQQSRNPLN